MKRTVAIMCAVVGIFLCRTVWAAEEWQLVAEKSQVMFLGRSTLHDFTGKARTMSGSFARDGKEARGAVHVDVAGLTTADPGRDKNMYRMFNVAAYKDINFTFDHMDISVIQQGLAQDIILDGVMTMHNVSRPVKLNAQVRMEGSVLVCQGDMEIHLKDYQLRPPSVLLMIRVADQVNVKYTMVFAKSTRP
jgi:polyisoprenoid-binding protein YceI